MISQGLFTGNIDNFTRKAWNINDQRTAFSAVFNSSGSSTASLIEPLVIPLAHSESILRNSGEIFEGSDLTVSLLNESLEYFQKALYNFNSQYLLAKNGYQTWAEVTNYYSSYFSLFSLLALQGRLISRIKLDGVNDVPCLLHPIDFQNHRYILTTKENRDATHKLPWKKYYAIYNNYACLKQEFDVIQLNSFVSDPVDESEYRNKINYKIYQGFQEVVNLNHLTLFKEQYLNALANPNIGDTLSNYLSALHALATDPNLKYFARSALRLLLIRNIYEEIGNINPNFKAELNSRVPIWQSTMFDNYDPKLNYYEDFAGTFLI